MVADRQVETMLLVVFVASMPIAASLKTQTFTNTSQAAGSGAPCTLADTSGCQDKDVILYNPVTNGDGSVQGLVLTFWSGQWGTVCDDVTDCDAPGGGTSPCSNGYVNVAGGQQLAAVVCRELGLDASGAQEYNADGSSSGYPIHVDGTSNHISGCAGTEAALADCAWLLYGSHNCGHEEDVGVICQPAGPTSSPTPSPTPAPTVAPTNSASATGDPHLTNVHGQKFDLMKPGKHVLINIPRGEPAENAFLRVQALAQRLGDKCGEMYFQEVNVTGSWAEATQAGGYHYSISQSAAKTPEWVAFGEVELKVVQGRTHAGMKYFNVYVKRLGRAGFVVGGLLGEDDHTDATQAPASCHRQVTLDGNADDQDSLSITWPSASSSFASFASASLE
ncbi:unnamed protein product [Prorocentrum cordatum]|uniref:SRCR domain-containing protein n=1 Tax=Prorocentrum cordatum TaxID=2364126 RepID=A0ABN9Q9H5_9DINO|nr:unnamed protein product [Polarella glacialis]